jgi:hypothetical protein
VFDERFNKESMHTEVKSWLCKDRDEKLSPDCGFAIRALAVAMDVILSLTVESWFFGARMVTLEIVLSCVPQFVTRAGTGFDEYLSIICNTCPFIKYFITP